MTWIESIGSVSTLIGLAGTALVLARSIEGRYRKTLGSRADLRDKLNLISCEATLEHVKQVLGPHVLQSRLLGDKGVRQHVYWMKHAWVSILPDEADEVVLAYSISVVDPKFAFSAAASSKNCLKVIVGRSRLSEAPSPKAWRYTNANWVHEYSELHYFGWPGLYQYFVLGNIDVGIGNADCDLSTLRERGVPDAAGEEFGADYYASDRPLPPALANLRSSTTINTLTVLGPRADPHLVKHWMPVGLHYQTAGLFTAYHRER